MLVWCWVRLTFFEPRQDEMLYTQLPCAVFPWPTRKVPSTYHTQASENINSRSICSFQRTRLMKPLKPFAPRVGVTASVVFAAASVATLGAAHSHHRHSEKFHRISNVTALPRSSTVKHRYVLPGSYAGTHHPKVLEAIVLVSSCMQAPRT